MAKVIIIGGGFGGLAAAKALAKADVEVLIIDRCNHHLFQPLLYQVATADLSPADIAWPIRSILARFKNISVALDDVVDIDPDRQQIVARSAKYDYDYLIIASGTATAYFGNDDWEGHAPGLKTIGDATRLRTRILMALENAETCQDLARRRRLMTFVVVGGGPTGVEMAGAVAELCRAALARDFRNIGPSDARVILVEGGSQLLGGFPSSLAGYAAEALKTLDVEVLTQQFVRNVSQHEVDLGSTTIESETVIWAAGVSVPGLSDWLEVEPGSQGRIKVSNDLTVPNHGNVFVVGDAAEVPWKADTPVPGIAPAAKQQGRYAGRAVVAKLKGETLAPFRYRHAGNLATIGRHRAVVDLGKVRLKGWPAWWFWGLIHIYFLIGARSATVVLLQWFWSYLTRKKGARLINDKRSESA